MKQELLKWTEQALESAWSIQVRRRIFRQLIESLIYEKVVPYSTELKEKNNEYTYIIETNQPDGKPVTYHFQAKQCFTFNRIRLTSEVIVRCCRGEEQEADSLRQFLLDISSIVEVDQEKLVHFIHELEQTFLKDTIAQYMRHQSGKRLKGSDYHQLEHNLMDGHPYHPSYKSRIGFDVEENCFYGPEFAQSIRPIWLAVKRKESVVSFSDNFKDVDLFVKDELGEDQYNKFCKKIRAKGQNLEDYIMVPVHPWQWKNQIITNFQDDLQRQTVIYLGESSDEYGAQQSIRTMTNLTNHLKPYLKLSLSIINTSTGRILAPHTVKNAALISDWLESVVNRDSYLNEEHQLILLKEVGGVAYHPKTPEGLQADTYGVISAIWRESVEAKMNRVEEAIPFNSLTALDLDGRPFIESFIQSIGLESWVRKLLDTSLLPILHLMFAHGIAMESHAQNMILVLKDGIPKRLALKDFHDGIRFSRQTLAHPELCPTLESTPEYHARINRNSFIETDDVEQVRDFMLDAFFFINLGELALFLSQHYSIEEKTFWMWVHQAIEQYQNRFQELKNRFELFNLYPDSIEVEQLTKRRLYPDTELRVHSVPNPLFNIRNQEENQ